MTLWATYRLSDGRVFALHEADAADWVAPAGHAIGAVSGGMPTPGPGSIVFSAGSGALSRVDTRTEAQAWADARDRRDNLLAATDWIVTRAVERGEAAPTAWAAYRQALRDITTQPDPFNISWPAAPA